LTGPNGGGTVLFSGFNFLPGTSSYTADRIEVTPEPIGEGGGFVFSLCSQTCGPDIPLEPFTAAPDTTVNFGIDYNWRFFIDPFSDSASLGMDPPFGDVLITENICVDPFVGNIEVGGCAGGAYSFFVDDTNPPASWNKTIPISPPARNGENIALAFLLTGGTTGAGFDSLSATYGVVDTLAPEPVSAVLGLGGLVAIVIRRRYRNA